MGHAIKLILNKRFKQTIIGMNIRYSKVSTYGPQ